MPARSNRIRQGIQSGEGGVMSEEKKMAQEAPRLDRFPSFPRFYDWVGWMDKYSSRPKNEDSLDQIVAQLGLPVLDPSDFYRI